MSHEHEDPRLVSALRDIAGDPAEQPVNWLELRRSIGERAAPELERRRLQHRRRRLGILVPAAALAASIAMFVVISRDGVTPKTDLRGHEPITPERSSSIDELLDADVSDGQFRAVLFGAGEADELLLLVAGDEKP